MLLHLYTQQTNDHIHKLIFLKKLDEIGVPHDFKNNQHVNFFKIFLFIVFCFSEILIFINNSKA